MGSKHANQVFKDATGFHSEKLVTDSKGVLTVHVKGTQNTQVKGYLCVWVPTEDTMPTLSFVSGKRAGKATITAYYKTQGGYTVTKKFTVTVN
ncbi:hypothetical protein BpJC7_32250 [Weizmannia acidilactici]|uniref:Uncharacterized protein n=2 Tax=Weizmannia acidilactici TaxID=2607726 RepID=A0A5J4JAY7_9BACI|nr:hypothetical protein BpJC7_32250 [Weizmannia acidilactici]GER72881.1 hypothetical protein BpPP18_09480 [Weizmannia acidilactici]